MSRLVIPAKLAGETVTQPFDFSSRLEEGVTISSASTTCEVYAGTDAAPADVIDGAATISGQTVLQDLTGGVVGVIYTLLCTATCSDGQVLQLSAYLSVIPDVV